MLNISRFGDGAQKNVSLVCSQKDVPLSKFDQASPISLPVRDLQKRILQLWEINNSLFASVEEADSIRWIPGDKIINPLQENERGPALLDRITSFGLTKWHLAFDPEKIQVVVWPHLIATGRDYSQATPEEMKSAIQQARIRKIFDRDEHLLSAQREVGREVVKKKDCGDPLDHAKEVRQEQRNFKKIIIAAKNRLSHEGKLSEANRAGYKEVISQASRLVDYSEKYISSIPMREKVIPKTFPSGKQFPQTTQQTRLPSSYNSSNPQNPIPAKAGPQGDIGGVACSVDYMEGLFEGIEGKSAINHQFYLPLVDGKPPFSDQELQQILREIAIGVYVHSTVPFFSLHFNQDGELFPVIHPAYENTLVGRVIGLLDYIMKAYLNGGIFQDGFIDAWAQDPSWDRKKTTALQQLIDFSEYCQQQMRGADQKYLSVSEVQGLLANDDAPFSAEPDLFKDFTQFSNSFRIISKQNGWEKHDNLLVINADFDVLYTIKPSAKYQEALDLYFREHGSFPPSYLRLKESFEVFRQRIHDHLSKFPLRKEYFAMLGIIGYFSSYFSTLKRHRKVPILTPLAANAKATCPALFPHLPTKAKEEIDLTLNLYEVFRSLSQFHRREIDQYRENFFQPGKFPQAETELRDCLKRLLITEIERHLSPSKLRAFRKNLSAPIAQNVIHGYSIKILQEIELVLNHLKEQQEEIQRIEQQIQSRTLTFSDEERSEIKTLIAKLQHEKDKAQQKLASYPKYEFGNRIDLTYESRLNITQGIEEINAILRNPDEHFHQLKSELNAKAKKQLLQDIQQFPNILLIPDINKNEKLASYTGFVLATKGELTPVNQLTGQRLLGGCGFEMKKGRVMSTRRANNLYLNLLPQLVDLPAEKWTVVNSDTGTGALFSLAFEDAASFNDNYRWMESLLIQDGETFWTAWEQAQINLAKDTPSQLLSQIKDNPSLLMYRDRDGRSLLHLAASSSKPTFATELLKLRFSPLEKDRFGNLPIHYAAMQKEGGCLQLLIQEDRSKQTIQAANRVKATPLMVAIQYGHLSNVEALVEAGARNSYSHTGYNTLHTALHHGYERIALYLIDRGIVTSASDLNCCAEEGGTPLMMACEIPSLNLATRLLAAGAQINQERKDGVTAIEIAIQMNSLPILQLLLSHADPLPHALETAAKEGSPEICSALAKKTVFSTYRNIWNDSLYHIAIRNGNIAPFLPLIEGLSQADFTHQNKRGESITSLAIEGGYWELLRLLKRKGVLPHSVVTFIDLLSHPYHPHFNELMKGVGLSTNDLQSLMQKAAEVGNMQAISLALIPLGGKLDGIKGPDGWRAIHYLAKADGIYLLTRYLANSINWTTEGKTLIEIAAANGSVRTLAYLLERAKKATIPFDPKWISLAISSLELEALKLVLEYSQDPKRIAEQHEALHLAAQKGSHECIKYLLSLGVDPNQKDKRGKSALYYAIRASAEKGVKYLLKKKAQVGAHEVYQAAQQEIPELFTQIYSAIPSVDHVVSERGNTPLMLAVLGNRPNAVKKLLSAGAHPFRAGEAGWTPSCYAAWKGLYEVLDVLLEYGVDKSVIRGKNALHFACEGGHPHMVRLLLKKGFTPDQKAIDLASSNRAVKHELGQPDDKIKQYLFALEGLNSVSQPNLDEVVRKLKELSLNGWIAYENKGMTPLQALLQQLIFLKDSPIPIYWLTQFATDLVNQRIPQLISEGLDPNLPDSAGNTLAHLFLQLNFNPSGLQGIDLSRANQEGLTPLHVAAKEATPFAFKEFLQQFKGDCNAEDRKGRTPIFYTLKGKHPGRIQELVQKGANVNHVDMKGISLLLLSIAQEELLFVRCLVENGADLHRPFTGEKMTALHLAIQNENREITQCLLNHGAVVKSKNSRSMQALHMAARAGNIPLCRILIAHGAPVDHAVKRGICAVHLAAGGGHVKVLQLLEGLGASLNCETQKGKTPLHLAVEFGQQEAVHFLLSRFVKIKDEIQNKQSILDACADSPLSLRHFRDYRFSENPELLRQAVIFALQQDNPETLNTLMSWGINHRTDLGDGQFLLHWASRLGSLQSTALLIEEGADVFLTTPEGETPLEIAASNSSWEQFDQLLEYCQCLPEFEIDQKNARGETLVHVAAKGGNLTHLSSLIWNGASHSLKDVQLNTPLDTVLNLISHQNPHATDEDLMLKAKREQVAKFLFICGGTMSDRHQNHPLILSWKRLFEPKDTPLHLAVRLNEPNALELHTKTSDLNAANDKGRTPLHIAAEMGNVSAAATLLKRGANPLLRDVAGNLPVALSQDDDLTTLLKKMGTRP